jgi:hypothetical protein
MPSSSSSNVIWETARDGDDTLRVAVLYDSLSTTTTNNDVTLPQTNSSSLIEPSDKPTSTSFPNHKIALLRATNYNQEQPIDIDSNTILHNSLITTNYTTIFNYQQNFCTLYNTSTIVGKQEPNGL